jgi:hypothetical protein
VMVSCSSGSWQAASGTWSQGGSDMRR